MFRTHNFFSLLYNLQVKINFFPRIATHFKTIFFCSSSSSSKPTSKVTIAKYSIAQIHIYLLNQKNEFCCAIFLILSTYKNSMPLEVYIFTLEVLCRSHYFQFQRQTHLWGFGVLQWNVITFFLNLFGKYRTLEQVRGASIIHLYIALFMCIKIYLSLYTN